MSNKLKKLNDIFDLMTKQVECQRYWRTSQIFIGVKMHLKGI